MPPHPTTGGLHPTPGNPAPIPAPRARALRTRPTPPPIFPQPRPQQKTHRPRPTVTPNPTLTIPAKPPLHRTWNSGPMANHGDKPNGNAGNCARKNSNNKNNSAIWSAPAAFLLLSLTVKPPALKLNREHANQGNPALITGANPAPGNPAPPGPKSPSAHRNPAKAFWK